jgi:ribosomal protein S18 acetylase RimI-like enzyme
VRRQLGSGYELDDDPARVDLPQVTRFLSTESYWARGRSAEAIARSIHAAARVVGLYLSDRQVGFARVVSDGVAFAYLADVYVLAEHRGRGLGEELVREAIEGGPHSGLMWLLHTADAHGLYAKLGFRAPSERLLERPRPERP